MKMIIKMFSNFLKKVFMIRIEILKILIVGLTAVLSLINFSNSDFKNEITIKQAALHLKF